MPRRVLWLAVALVLAISSAPDARADDDLRTALKFVQGLRERGYFDLAGEYLETLGKTQSIPTDMKPVVEYELGKNLLESAARTGDLERRKELLDQARGRLENFTKNFPTSPLAPDALVQLARLLVERGHLAMLQADEMKTPSEKSAKVAEARGSFGQGRSSYDTAIAKLKPIYEAFNKFIPDDDPRKEQRDQAHVALMSAELQRAVVDYEEGETYASGTPERKKLMEGGLARFEEIYNNYREWMAGFYARMWQAKCYMERDDLNLNAAMGIFNELMIHEAPRLRELQRSVGYQRILIMGKRKEYPLAADECVRWLQANPNARRTPDGLGVQLELAKNILAQLPDIERPADQEAAKKRATDSLTLVVRDYSAHKAEALQLLKKYKPKSAVNLSSLANMTYENAMGDADEAIAAEDWNRARAVLKVGAKRAEMAHDIDKHNRARYLLAYIDYKSGHFYDSAIMAEHLARRYPSGGLSPKAVEIAIQSLLEAYNVYAIGDRIADLDRVVALAQYASETWPDSEQGDFGRVVLGEVALGRGKYPEAIAAFETVRSASGRWADAQTRLGAAHWKQSLILRTKEPAATAEADAEVQKALGVLQAAIKARVSAGAPPSDPGYVANACDLADIQLELGNADQAFALLNPLVGPLTEAKAPAELRTRVFSDILRAHIGLGEVEKALEDMKSIEAAGGAGASQAQLYFKLGQLLEKELESREKKNDRAGIAKIQASYQKFLDALATSKTGQSYESLQWAGEAMLTIGRAKEAKAVFDRVLENYEKDPAFTGKLGAGDKLLRTKLKRVSALRGSKDFATASTEIAALMEANKRLIEPRMELAMLAEAKAETGAATWDAPFTEWKKLASQLGSGTGPKPVEYYDANYHMAYALWKQKKPALAKQTLASILKLSPTVGSPAMKSKYQELIKRIGS